MLGRYSSWQATMLVVTTSIQHQIFIFTLYVSCRKLIGDSQHCCTASAAAYCGIGCRMLTRVVVLLRPLRDTQANHNTLPVQQYYSYWREFVLCCIKRSCFRKSRNLDEGIAFQEC